MAKRTRKFNYDSIIMSSDNYRKLSDLCEFYRGQFLHQMTELETIFDDIITIYFCPKEDEKREELLYVILLTEKMTLFGKYQVVSFIMHKNFQWYYDKHSPKKTKENKNNPPKSLDNDVQDLIHLRNKFAHRQLRIPLERGVKFDGKTVELDTKVGKDGKIEPSPLLLNDTKMVGFMGQFSRLKSIFDQFLNLVWDKEGAITKEEEQP